MTLKENIDSQIKKAMLSKDADRLRALRGIKSVIMVAETEKGKSGELTPDREIDVLKKAAKQRRDSSTIYINAGKSDLAKIELDELSVIEEFLPKQMSEEEIKNEIHKILNDWVTSNAPIEINIKILGNLIKEFNHRFPGQDGKIVSTLAKSMIS